MNAIGQYYLAEVLDDKRNNFQLRLPELSSIDIGGRSHRIDLEARKSLENAYYEHDARMATDT
jgi:hypothetical protein